MKYYRLCFLLVLFFASCVPAESVVKPFLKLCAEGSPSGIWKAISTGADVEEKDEAGMTALMYAAAYNKNPLSAQELIKFGADVKARSNDGRTALMYAAALNPTADVLDILLKAGSEVNARTDEGWTALTWAVSKNPNQKIIIKLLDAGTDPKLGRLGKKALDFAKNRADLKGTEALRRLEAASK